MDVNIGFTTLYLPPFGQIVFIVAAGVGILSAIMMITRANAVHSALWLVLAFFNLAVMYVMLGAEFLAALQVLVYTGAILVLFLFVIMLLGLKERTQPQLGALHTAQLVAAWPVGLILALQIIVIIIFSRQPSNVQLGDIIGDTTNGTQHFTTYVWSAQQVLNSGGNVKVVGITLYSQFLLPFEIASLILLVAILGAIVLARKEEPAEVEEVLPSLGISVGRRSIADSPQESQIEKKLLPALGVSNVPDATEGERELPIVEQPAGVGAGTTSGLEPKDET